MSKRLWNESREFRELVKRENLVMLENPANVFNPNNPRHIWGKANPKYGFLFVSRQLSFDESYWDTFKLFVPVEEAVSLGQLKVSFNPKAFFDLVTAMKKRKPWEDCFRIIVEAKNEVMAKINDKVVFPRRGATVYPGDTCIVSSLEDKGRYYIADVFPRLKRAPLGIDFMTEMVGARYQLSTEVDSAELPDGNIEVRLKITYIGERRSEKDQLASFFAPNIWVRKKEIPLKEIDVPVIMEEFLSMMKEITGL